MTTKPTCFCGGDGKYVDHNCGETFYVECPHCQGSGEKKCSCTEVTLVCKTYGRGQEIVDRRESGRDDDDIHWNFLD